MPRKHMSFRSWELMYRAVIVTFTKMFVFYTKTGNFCFESGIFLHKLVIHDDNHLIEVETFLETLYGIGRQVLHLLKILIVLLCLSFFNSIGLFRIYGVLHCQVIISHSSKGKSFFQLTKYINFKHISRDE